MNPRLWLIPFFSILFFPVLPLHAELHPLKGPATGKLGDMAEIKVPEGYEFFGKDDMKEFMQKTQNLYTGDELGVLLDPDKASGFISFFMFDESGYVKDAAKEKLDPDQMWKQMKDNEPAANEERKKNGWGEITLIKWAEIPQYNAQTQRLEWADVLEEKNQQWINYNTKILGRKGVMQVIVVPHGKNWQSVIPRFNQAIDGFSYTGGNKYAEWKTGDKVAEFGLAALVVGGAGAVCMPDCVDQPEAHG